MEIISTRLIDALTKMGLSHHEARVYAALVYFNSVEAKQLIDFVQISKPSVYESLQRLQEYGLVNKKNAKPAIFTPVSPRVAVDILTRENVKASEIAYTELDKISKIRKNTDEEDTIFTVYGEKSVEHKIKEMISSAKKHILCVMGEKYLPLFSHLNTTTSAMLYIISGDPDTFNFDNEILKKNRISISVIGSQSILEKELKSKEHFTKFKYFNLMNVFNIIVDDRETLFIPPLETVKTTGLYSVNEVIVYMVQEKIRNMIQDHGPYENGLKNN